jgi:hypothetical protein
MRPIPVRGWRAAILRVLLLFLVVLLLPAAGVIAASARPAQSATSVLAVVSGLPQCTQSQSYRKKGEQAKQWSRFPSPSPPDKMDGRPSSSTSIDEPTRIQSARFSMTSMRTKADLDSPRLAVARSLVLNVPPLWHFAPPSPLSFCKNNRF